MYIILFYDIADRTQKERDNSRRIRKACEKYLNRVQFSVFEGQLSASSFKTLQHTLKKECVETLDSIIIYCFEGLSYSTRHVIGLDKNEPLFT